VDCEDLLNLPIAERIVLVQGRHGFLGNSEQERPWFSYDDRELLKSKELLKVQEDARMVSSDEEWNPDSDAEAYRKVLLSDMELLVRHNVITDDLDALDLQFFNASSASNVMWASQDCYALPQIFGVGWSYWLKPNGESSAYAYLLEQLRGTLSEDYYSVTGPSDRGNQKKTAISYQPGPKEIGGLKTFARSAIEQFCGPEAAYGALWVSSSLVKAELVVRIAKEWNLTTVNEIVAALSPTSLADTQLCSLAVRAEDANLPPAAIAVWNALRDSLMKREGVCCLRYEWRVEVQANRENIPEGCNKSMPEILDALFDKFNDVLNPRSYTNLWQAAADDEEDEDEEVRDGTHPFFSALKLEDVLKMTGWAIQYFCWAVRHVLAHWVRIHSVLEFSRAWLAPPRSILIALQVISENLQTTLMGIQPLRQSAAHLGTSEFSLFFEMQNIHRKLGAPFAGAPLKPFALPTTENYGECPWTGCLVNVDLHEMPAKIMELSHKHKPDDYRWGMSWIDAYFSDRARASAKRNQHLLFSAVYGSNQGFSLLSTNWSSLTMPMQLQQPSEEVEVREGDEMANILVVQPPALPTWDRFIRCA